MWKGTFLVHEDFEDCDCSQSGDHYRGCSTADIDDNQTLRVELDTYRWEGHARGVLPNVAQVSVP